MGKLKNIINRLFKVNYTCNLCGRELFNNENFCTECADSLEVNAASICQNCGRSTPTDMERCISCKGAWAVDKARSYYNYNESSRQLIHRYKYYEKRYYVKIFGEQLFELYLKNCFAPDIITFVPMTAAAIFERGYNQSEALAAYLAHKTGVKLSSLLKKERETPHQVELGYKERRVNLKGCFSASERVDGKRVLLVDDVLTTGSTSDVIAELLKKKGAASVYLLTVCSVQKFNN